jgi:hypothetical protein
VGSIGLVAAVPLTTWLAVWAVGGRDDGHGRTATPRDRRAPDAFADDE